MKHSCMLILILISSIHAFAQNGVLEITNGDLQNSININSLDSITFETHGNSMYHRIWKNGDCLLQQISEGDSIHYTSNNQTYTTFEDPSNGIASGILFENGSYGLAMNNKADSRKILIFGNSLDLTNILVVELDEYDMIRKICIGDDFYTIKYLSNYVIVNHINNSDHQLVSEIKVPYSKFYLIDEPSKEIKRVSSVTDNPWYKGAQMVDAFIGLKNIDAASYLSGMLQMQNNKNVQDTGRVIGFLGSILTLNPLGIAIGLLDMHDLIGERMYYGGASVETGTSQIYNCNNAILTAKINNFSQINFSGFELDCSMRVWDSNDNGYSQTKSNISSATELNFDFNNLDFNTIYNYQATLNLYYYDILYNPNISMSGLFFSTPSSSSIEPVRLRCSDYLQGEIKFFRTSSPAGSIEEISDKTEHSVNIHCLFSNIPDGASCGVYVWEENGSQMPYAGTSSTGSQVINVSGLDAATLYYCQAYVNANGVLFLSDQIESFETEQPDVSGTWNCTQKNWNSWNQTYTETTYTITLHEDGTVTHTSSMSSLDPISSSWSYGKGGVLNISIMDIATQTQNHGLNWEFKTTTPKDPKEFEGSVYGWNFNDVIGYRQGDSSSCKLYR